MEQRLLADVGRNPNLSPKWTDAALSLITNPYTSDQTLFSISESLILQLQDADSDHRKILSLLYAISRHHPRLRLRIAAASQSFIYLPSTPTSSLPHAISLIEPGHSAPIAPFADESLFLSLCFWNCVKTRRWMLRNVSDYRLRPSLLLMVLLGLTKDPYPYIKEAALDGLVMLCNSVVVDDRSLIEGCYFRAAELLFDADTSVRGAAVRVVSKWGRLIQAMNPDTTHGDWSDALFVQLCIMVRDTDMEIRVAAFEALGTIQNVSEDILLQTLSKKPLAATKDKNYRGQYTAKLFKIPATAAAFSFIHGLEDEFYQVRRSACCALQKLAVLSAKFSGGVVDRMMDMLNDDAVVVRLQALITLHHIAMNGHFTVEASQLQMFLGTLIDNNALIRSAARKSLQLIKLQKLAMFKSCIDSLIKNMELYPEDEADIFNVLYKIGRTHGKYVTTIINGLSEELEPSFDGKLDSNKARTAALLVLAISAPVSLERQICSIPPQIYSCAVTLLGRVSCGLVDFTDQSTLLSHLTRCSRFTIASSSESLEGEVQGFHSNHVQFLRKDAECSPLSLESAGLLNLKVSNCLEIVMQKTVDLWSLVQLGCMNEVLQTLRSWKEELKFFSCGSCQLSGVMTFVLKYLHVIKLLAKIWCETSLHFREMRVYDALFGKMEKRLKEILYRFVGLGGQEKLHILELMLVTYTLKAYCGGICCFDDCMKKLNRVLFHVECLQKEGSVELSDFVIELQKVVSGEVDNFKDGNTHRLSLLKKSLSLFTLKHMVLAKELKYLDVKLDISDNDFQNPYPFIPGMPVGIPLDITLSNISNGSRFWLVINLGEKCTQFVFMDLDEFEGCNKLRKLTLVAPFYRTPKVKHFSLKVSVAMECLFEDHYSGHSNKPKHELIHLCKGKEVHLSMTVK
ncbi:protein SIEL [Andrographis paniculata]|uniref:protein SIEL n=1 Tax=Andrographis paniculata TaxID=175694 RepID=UPI0021E8149E|nr:protein SIEL [Andrographis paniculata]XP_051130334.1 protein SIEL [Andrographis paniculata]